MARHVLQVIVDPCYGTNVSLKYNSLLNESINVTLFAINKRMSHGNASPDDARRVSHWIDQETQTRIGIRACLADLRRERDRIAEAFEKIQLDRKKTKHKRQDFESVKRSQQQHCDRLHFILDGNPEFKIISKTLDLLNIIRLDLSNIKLLSIQ